MCVRVYFNSTRYAAPPFTECKKLKYVIDFWNTDSVCNAYYFLLALEKNNIIYCTFSCDRAIRLDIIGLRFGVMYMIYWSDADTVNLSPTVEIPRVVRLLNHSDILRNEIWGHTDWCDVTLFVSVFNHHKCFCRRTSIWRNLNNCSRFEYRSCLLALAQFG
jgi:hypothetical protein